MNLSELIIQINGLDAENLKVCLEQQIEEGKKGKRNESFLKLGLLWFGSPMIKEGKIVFGGIHKSTQNCIESALKIII